MFSQGACVNAECAIERPLPHNAEAERAILSAILLGGPASGDATSSIEPSDFFLPQHQTIFSHMKRLRERGVPTNDYILLYESLDATGELDAAGGIAYISQIPDGWPRINNITHYVEIVRLKAQVRRRIYTAQAILETALGANGNASEVLGQISSLSAQLREEAGQSQILRFMSGAEIAMDVDKQTEWIVPGFVVRGGITELGAKVKAGKTTLIMKLVRAAADGLDFLGKPTLKTPAVYLTEQPAVSFRQAMERADLLGRDDFHVLFHNDTRGLPWPLVASAAIEECKREGAFLLVVDTLPQFAGLKGDSENNSGDALTAMEPLSRAAAEGIGVVLTRHERKSGGEVGDSGRGSSAFAGAVDIVLSLRKPVGNSKKTQRVLQAISRFAETPAELLIELAENDYIALGEPHDAAVREAKDLIIAIAPEAETEAMTLKEIMESSEIPRSTAQRAVEELLREELLSKVGGGKRNSPYRYFKTENPSCPTSNTKGQRETERGNQA
jgi:hypothetical protein